jgi:hypothetical protein
MTKFKLPDNTVILYFLALANAIGFAWASIAIEGGGGNIVSQILFAARGVFVGLAAGFGMASISNRLPHVRTKAAKIWGYVGLGIIAAAAPVMMSPVIYSRLISGDMKFLPWQLLAVISIASGLLVDGLVLGIAATSGKLQDDEKTDKPLLAQDAPQPRKKPAQGKRKPVSKAEFIAILKSNAGKNDEQLAQLLGVKRQAVQQRRSKLSPAELGF